MLFIIAISLLCVEIKESFFNALFPKQNWYLAELRSTVVLALPIFISGIIKYGQRVWALRCASSKQLIDSFFSTPKNGNPSSVKEKEPGFFDVVVSWFTEDKAIPDEEKFLPGTFQSFVKFRPLFLDLPFEISNEFHNHWFNLKPQKVEDAFNFVRIELEFLYELLYTKNHARYRRHVLSLILDILCFSSVVVVLIAFSASLAKMTYSTVDIAVTYLLLTGAVSLEISSFVMHSRSKWAVLRRLGLAHYRNELHNWRRKHFGSGFWIQWMKRTPWQMAQHDLIEYSVKASKSPFTPIVKFIDTGNLLQRFWHLRWKPVDEHLKEFIYNHLKAKRAKFEKDGFKHEHLRKLLDMNGDNVIKEKNLLLEDDYNKKDFYDFTRRIFVWHIATALIYHDVDGNHKTEVYHEIGKSLSDYMMYLVLVRPTMLPNGYSEVFNKETYRHTRSLVRATITEGLEKCMKQFSSTLLSSNCNVEDGALLDGVKLAKKLKGWITDNDEQSWKMISEVWMEMMVYCASRCIWKEHAQQLCHGGELITHVSLLMAHLGLNTQIYRSQQPDEEHCSQLRVCVQSSN